VCTFCRKAVNFAAKPRVILGVICVFTDENLCSIFYHSKRGQRFGPLVSTSIDAVVGFSVAAIFVHR